MKEIPTNLHMVNDDFRLEKYATEYEGSLTKEEGLALLNEKKETLKVLQEKLYAQSKQSVLIVLQAMDAAGKDSLIEHVFGGVNPQGCSVTNFKTPSSEEYGHDFLWRHYCALPEKGKIGIFNRSHYESVLVCKVHPEYNLSEKTWDSVSQIDADFWKNRFESIRNFEAHLAQNGTKIIKFYLHLSKKEQKKRLLDRINEEDKNWKFAMGDLKERTLFDVYNKAYETAIKETDKKNAPWYILPADTKWYTRLAALQIIIETMEGMNLSFPKISDDEKQNLKLAKEQLENE